MLHFNSPDPFGLDDQLGVEERAIRDTANACAQDRPAPRVIDASAREHTDPG